jgi:hypothetical protein
MKRFEGRENSSLMRHPIVAELMERKTNATRSGAAGRGAAQAE